MARIITFALLVLLAISTTLAAPLNFTKPVTLPATIKLPANLTSIIGKLPANVTAKLPANVASIKLPANLTASLRAAYVKFSATCVYGRSCGACASNLATDNLDQACQVHDQCLATLGVKWNQTGAGACNRQLAQSVAGILGAEKKCSRWNVFCKEANKLQVAQGMQVLFAALGRL